MFNHLRFNSPTLVIIFVTILSFVIQMTYDPYEGFLILNKGDLLNAPHTLITHMFLHADFSHLLFNMFGVLIFGSLLERRLKDYQYYLLYFTSGFLAGLLGNFIYTAALGASAGVMALVGTTAFLFPKVVFYLMGVFPMQLRTLAFLYFIFDFMGALGMNNVANSAHIVGMFSGIVFAFLLVKYNLNPKKILRVEAHVSKKNSGNKRSPERVILFDNKYSNESRTKKTNFDKKNENYQNSSTKKNETINSFAKKKYVTPEESSSYLSSRFK